MSAQVELFKSGARAIGKDDLFTIIISHNGSAMSATMSASEWSKMIANPKTMPLCGAG